MSIKSQVFVSKNAPYEPSWFLLKALYHLAEGRLRLRWSDRVDQWAVEIQVARPVQYITSLKAYVKRKDGAVVENDSWVRARDGYALIGYYAANPKLGEWVITDLRHNDIRRIGGADAADLMLVRQEEKKRERLDREFSIKSEAFSKDVFERMVWSGGERVAVPFTYGDIK